MGGLMLGLFEPVAKPWGMAKPGGLGGIPEDFSFGEIAPDWERMMPHLELAMKRIPIVKEVGIHKFFCGPESFTPDGNFILGEAPELTITTEADQDQGTVGAAAHHAQARPIRPQGIRLTDATGGVGVQNHSCVHLPSPGGLGQAHCPAQLRHRYQVCGRRGVATETRSRGRGPAVVGAAVGPGGMTPQPGSVHGDSSQVRMLYDGDDRTAQVFMAGMSIPLLGIRLFAESMKPFGELLKLWQANQAAAARAAQGAGEEIAEKAAREAAMNVAGYFEERKPWLAASPDPFKAMFADAMRPLIENVTRAFMPQEGEESAPPGFTRRKEQADG